MRKLVVALITVLSFFFFLYLTFPIGNVVEKSLCQHKISYTEVQIRRLPLRIELKDIKLPQLPVVFDRVVLSPRVFSFLSREKQFNVLVYKCGGVLDADADYPVSKVKFKLEKLNVNKCFKAHSLPLSISATIRGNGNLSITKNGLVGGRGRFDVKGTKLSNLKFGLFSLKDADLGDVTATYKVTRKNVVDVEANGNGKDGKLSVRGYVDVNVYQMKRSYVNLKVRFIPYTEPFKGKIFSFRIKGFLENLSFR